MQKNSKRALGLILGSSLSWVAPGFAGTLDKAWEYYHQGDYNQALHLARPLAIQNNTQAQALAGIAAAAMAKRADDSATKQGLYDESKIWTQRSAFSGNKTAKGFLEQVAKAGGPAGSWASNQLMTIYLRNAKNTKKGTLDAYRWAVRAASLGSTEGRAMIPELEQKLVKSGEAMKLAESYDRAGQMTAAKRWYTMLGDAGHVKAQARMGDIIWQEGKLDKRLEGDQLDVKLDPVKEYPLRLAAWEAFGWYHKAAQQGHHESILKLSESYFLGYGVDEDPMRAYIFLKLAWNKGAIKDRQGLIYLKSKLAILEHGVLGEGQLTPSQKDEAKQYLASGKVPPPPEKPEPPPPPEPPKPPKPPKDYSDPFGLDLKNDVIDEEGTLGGRINPQPLEEEASSGQGEQTAKKEDSAEGKGSNEPTPSSDQKSTPEQKSVPEEKPTAPEKPDTEPSKQQESSPSGMSLVPGAPPLPPGSPPPQELIHEPVPKTNEVKKIGYEQPAMAQ